MEPVDGVFGHALRLEILDELIADDVPHGLELGAFGSLGVGCGHGGGREESGVTRGARGRVKM